MSGMRDKSGKPLNSDAWGEDHQLAVSKASALAMNSKAPKDAITAANKAVSDTMSGYQQALEAEKKKKGGQPPNTGAASSLFGGLFGQ
jgi:hypothetical protein